MELMETEVDEGMAEEKEVVDAEGVTAEKEEETAVERCTLYLKPYISRLHSFLQTHCLLHCFHCNNILRVLDHRHHHPPRKLYRCCRFWCYSQRLLHYPCLPTNSLR